VTGDDRWGIWMTTEETPAGDRGYRFCCWLDSWMIPILAVAMITVVLVVWGLTA
jgi:hypothetical protein